MGNVEDWQSGAWLFWGAEKSEIAAIQILPVTPVNEVGLFQEILGVSYLTVIGSLRYPVGRECMVLYHA